ncbi:PTS fructose transporter subunit IIA [Thiocapsa imhoffii]|uniref:PTS fructose transporter subunit IIA n=1 Tax=Thiocapsa imhoffii TaxID=382777 RepID=A0A9X0WG08_9GAMM|nr:PTS fructose transporter subunit IIA [Thiocapsa imhoffii]MBK1643492.1 PTS fructose transporter subunit IIA [Thiocapsa imhoffii]
MSVGLLLITHQPFGGDLLRIATSILGALPPGIAAMEVVNDVPCDCLLAEAREHLRHLDTGSGVLVMTDLFGATPANVAVTLLSHEERVQVLAGLNLPMLLRAWTYCSSDLDTVTEKALQGGRDGVLRCLPRDAPTAHEPMESA